MIFTMNDDRMLMEFLSGRYLGYPEAHSIYMNYPFTLLITSLYRMFPSYNWYCYTLIAVMIVCAILVFVRCLQYAKEKKKWSLLTLAAVLIFVIMGPNFVSITYSTVAATVGVTTLFWYGTSNGTKVDVAISAFLAALTWCIRDELFIMILPAAGLIWLFREVLSKKSPMKKMVTPLSVAGCVAVCILCDAIAYSSPEWEKYNDYNLETRTEIYDYRSDYYFPNFDENKEYYEEVGLTNEQRRNLIYLNFLYLQDEISTETIEKIVAVRDDYGNSEEFTWKSKIKDGTENLIIHLQDGQYDMRFYLGVIGLLGSMLLLIIKKNWIEVLKSGLILASMLSVIWLMEIRGRVPERVTDSMSMMLFVMMILVWVWNYKEIADLKWKKLFIISSMCVLGFVGIMSTQQEIVKAKEIKNNNIRYEDIRNFCQSHPEDFFVVSVGAMNKYGMNVTAEKVDNQQNNYISSGDWMAYSPIQKTRLEQEGIESMAESLLSDDSIYIISEEDNYLFYAVDYLESRFGKEIVINKTDEVNSLYFVYQLDFKN